MHLCRYRIESRLIRCGLELLLAARVPELLQVCDQRSNLPLESSCRPALVLQLLPRVPLLLGEVVVVVAVVVVMAAAAVAGSGLK